MKKQILIALVSAFVASSCGSAWAMEVGDAIMKINDQMGAHKNDEALKTIDAYLKEHPDFTQFYLQKGYVELQQKQYDAALKSLNHCLTAGYKEIGPKAVDSLNAEVWIYIGHCKLAKGDKDGAKEAFKKGFALYPNLEPGLVTLKQMTAGTGLAVVAADKLELIKTAREML